jgi:hypothetical protein
LTEKSFYRAFVLALTKPAARPALPAQRCPRRVVIQPRQAPLQIPAITLPRSNFSEFELLLKGIEARRFYLFEQRRQPLCALRPCFIDDLCGHNWLRKHSETTLPEVFPLSRNLAFLCAHRRRLCLCCAAQAVRKGPPGHRGREEGGGAMEHCKGHNGPCGLGPERRTSHRDALLHGAEKAHHDAVKLSL